MYDIYVERWMRFIEFKLVYTKLIRTNRRGTRTNRRGNKGEIVFSQHAVIPVYVNCSEICQVFPTILLFTFINIREAKN